MVSSMPLGACPSANRDSPIKTLYRQGAIENLFRKSMAEKGLKVKHDTVPIALELVKDSADLQDPNAYPAKVCVGRNLA